VLVRLVLTGLVVALAVAAAACGGDGGAAAPEEDPDEPVRVLPACAGAKAGAEPELPVEFPLPPGTVVTSSESPFAGQVVVLGLIPANLQEAASFFGGALPEHGYQVGVGDSEGNEAEAPFTGNGYRGKWRVNEIPNCRAVRLTLVLIEQA
jgi:hypothetical protein